MPRGASCFHRVLHVLVVGDLLIVLRRPPRSCCARACPMLSSANRSPRTRQVPGPTCFRCPTDCWVVHLTHTFCRSRVSFSRSIDCSRTSASVNVGHCRPVRVMCWQSSNLTSADGHARRTSCWAYDPSSHAFNPKPGPYPYTRTMVLGCCTSAPSSAAILPRTAGPTGAGPNTEIPIRPRRSPKQVIYGGLHSFRDPAPGCVNGCKFFPKRRKFSRNVA